ncbi:MAG: prephenate dehydrogenase/arogenate dehydrogenase family protein [Chloroflexota bacterium]
MAARTAAPGPAAAAAAAAATLPERIVFLGFGLIGGSIALALREAGVKARLVAWTPEGAGPAEGLRRGILDAAPRNPATALEGAGLVILAGPPRSVVAHLQHLGGPMRRVLTAETTVTDVASTKALIVATAQDLGIPFVGGHPMAGRETTGVGAATAELFVDRPWVVIPAAGTPDRDVDRVRALATATGARPVAMTADDHDVAVAAISHLPLVASVALVESVAADASRWEVASSLAAGGWRDMTRLARGDERMGADIIATNAGPLARQLRAYRDVIDGWLARLDAMTDEAQPEEPSDATVVDLRERLEAARATLERGPRP